MTRLRISNPIPSDLAREIRDAQAASTVRIVEHAHCPTWAMVSALTGALGGALAGFLIWRLLDR